MIAECGAPAGRLVSDRIAECRGDKAPLRVRGNHAIDQLGGLVFAVLHRISFAERLPDNRYPVPDALLDAPAIAARDTALAGIGRMAYHLVVRTDGRVEQAIPLGRSGAHSRGYNALSIGVAVVGDFRSRPPAPEQWISLVRLLSLVCLLDLQIVAHDRLAGASADEGKICPGPLLDVHQVAAAVAREMAPGWTALPRPQREDAVLGAGLVL